VPKTRIFLGSSTAAKNYAERFADHFETENVSFVRWWEAFTPGRTLLGELDELPESIDAALLVFSPEIPGTVRGDAKDLVNQNVLFEFGYFYGRLGPLKTALVKLGEFYLPTDLAGYTYINAGKFARRGRKAPISATTEKAFYKWLSAV
jgi:predicted nucleotide-binding protein